MSKRWKFQISRGLFFAIFIMGFNALSRLKEDNFWEQFTSPRFYIAFVVLLIVCVFGIGYFDWQRVNGKETWAEIFGRKKNN